MNRQQIRREANVLAAQAIRNFLRDGSSWQNDWTPEDNYILAERMGEIADALGRR